MNFNINTGLELFFPGLKRHFSGYYGKLLEEAISCILEKVRGCKNDNVIISTGDAIQVMRNRCKSEHNMREVQMLMIVAKFSLFVSIFRFYAKYHIIVY